MEHSQSTTTEKSTVVKPAIKASMLLFESISVAFVLYVMLFIFVVGNDIIPLTFIFSSTMNVITVLLTPLLVFVFLFSLWRWATLNASEYRFFEDRVEYYEGFLVKNRKTVAYERITNVGQRRNIIERIFGLGTIYLETAGTSDTGNEMKMSYLESSDDVYQRIVRITTKSRAKSK